MSAPRFVYARHGDSMGSSSSSSMSGMDMASGSSSSTGCVTNMLGNWETTGVCVLTSSWRIQNKAMFAGTCIGVFLLVVLIEMVRRWGREWDRYIVRKEIAARAHFLATATPLEPSAGMPGAHNGAASPDDKESSSGGHTESQSHAVAIQAPTPWNGRLTACPNSLQQRAFSAGLPPNGAAAACWSTPIRASRFRPTLFQQAVRSLLYAIQFAGAYIVMLIAMTFNGYILLSIVLGGFFSHFVSTWDALAFDLASTDQDPYLLANGGGTGAGAGVESLGANGACAATAAAAKASDQSYHASGVCCG
ncbi:Ctr-domain-containing protein [Tilletiaria anomala UBC 951]|uniref:Copper transport protein n=1 Tax=Tilletiaria anomala (strain ATCC 24038 / CBS 436.72 / UBC 951) TaxID=1037660 RepID=A0A066VXV9_TILAU|nr:Ctr-domain-containing protein [Tilletiaria anomala UBC 951]KDN43659.1 Ctr-domain-containing protein [Tilletiaria anomala UBC 951]